MKKGLEKFPLIKVLKIAQGLWLPVFLLAALMAYEGGMQVGVAFTLLFGVYGTGVYWQWKDLSKGTKLLVNWWASAALGFLILMILEAFEIRKNETNWESAGMTSWMVMTVIALVFALVNHRVLNQSDR